MPLYMDFHKFETVTIELVKTGHMADHAVQEAYGVRYHQFWVNQDAGTVFCLVEGPDQETCELVHRIAHGNVACAMTEVEIGFYEKLMGKEQKIDEGLVQHKDGTIDIGYRNILVATVYGITKATSSKDFSQLQTPHWARKLISEKMAACKGREIKWETDDSLIGVFTDSSLAVKCALQIRQALRETNDEEPDIIFKIGVSAAQPVTEKGDFFTDAIRMAHRLSILAPYNQILISSLVRKLCTEDELLAGISSIKSLNDAEEQFVSNLLRIAEAKLSDQQFDLNSLSSEICISRPQLYRKITALTGRSPNDFMRDLRMDKALTLLKRKTANISEIAFVTGFNSPSYFTKCFAEKFGCTPSAFVKASIS